MLVVRHASSSTRLPAADAQRRRARNRNIAFALAVFVALLVLGGLLGIAVWEREIAERELYREEVEQAARLATSMTEFGHLYYDGRGVAQDYNKAREWYEKAAAKGSADAMRSLGELYEHGDGVAQDYNKAREWYEKAATKGDEFAKKYLERLSNLKADVGPRN